MLHLITLTLSTLTQQEVHKYFCDNFDKVITQKEYHKSGKPHFHILIESDIRHGDLQKLIDILNPPVNQYTNNIRYNVNSISGTYVYVTKDKRINKPLYHGFIEAEVNKIITKYRKNNKDQLDPYNELAEKAAKNFTQSWDAIKDYFYCPSSKYLPLINELLKPYEELFSSYLLDYDYLVNYSKPIKFEKKYLYLYKPDRYIYSYLALLNGETQTNKETSDQETKKSCETLV